MRLANKYWSNNFNTKDSKDLNKKQYLLLKAISITKLLTIIALILHVLTLFISSI